MNISAVWQEDQDGVPGSEGEPEIWQILVYYGFFDHSPVYGTVYKKNSSEEKKEVSEETELSESGRKQVAGSYMLSG